MWLQSQGRVIVWSDHISEVVGYTFHWLSFSEATPDPLDAIGIEG